MHGHVNVNMIFPLQHVVASWRNVLSLKTCEVFF